MRHRERGSEVRPEHQQPARDAAQPDGESRSSTSGSRRPTPRPRSCGAWPSASSPRRVASAPSPYTPQAELSPADKARRLAASRLIAAYIPRFGVRVETGGAIDARRPRREGPPRPGEALRDRPGGYTRIVKFGPRRGDNAPISLIELVGDGDEAATDDSGKGAAKLAKSRVATATAAEPRESAKVE